MKRLLTIFSILIFQFSISAQLINSNTERGLFSENYITNVNVNPDSVMLDSIIGTYKYNNTIPGLATLIIKDNQIVWHKNYGYRNLQNQLPVDDSTLFVIASISKTITATAVMQLWENGLVDLDSNVNNYLPVNHPLINPNFLNNKITIKMLLTHTSSLIDNMVYQYDVCGDSQIKLDSFLINYYTPGGIFYQTGNFSQFLPGSKYIYSNIGACILALIVENVSGKSFDVYCRDSIFTPLSMNSATWFLQGMDTTKLAVCYFNPNTPYCHGGCPHYPAGFLKLTINDLGKFLSAYMNKGVFNNSRILDSATINYIMQDYLGHTIIEGLAAQGLIWYNYLPYKFWSHDGYGSGLETYMGFNRDENSGAIWFQNFNVVTRMILVPTLDLFIRYAWLYGNIYAFNPMLNKYCLEVGDSILFLTRFINKDNNTFIPSLTYINSDSTITDSVTLFDDGLHGDFLANDNIYGNYISSQQEDFYSLDVSTINNQTNKYFATPDICRFTTVPLKLDSVRVTQEYPIQYSFEPVIKNYGTIRTLENLVVFINSSDSGVIDIYPKSWLIPDILSGQSFSVPKFTITYDSTMVPDSFHLTFKITSNEYTYWNLDTVITMPLINDESEYLPISYSLSQNFPNPFNPVTTIKYSVPKTSKVQIKVFDVLGKEMELLVNEEKQIGNYELKWSNKNIPSGVYFYQLKAGDFIQTKKMILIK